MIGSALSEISTFVRFYPAPSAIPVTRVSDMMVGAVNLIKQKTKNKKQKIPSSLPPHSMFLTEVTSMPSATTSAAASYQTRSHSPPWTPNCAWSTAQPTSTTAGSTTWTDIKPLRPDVARWAGRKARDCSEQGRGESFHKECLPRQQKEDLSELQLSSVCLFLHSKGG